MLEAEWRSRSDGEIQDALTRMDDYRREAQQAILSEARRRHLPYPELVPCWRCRSMLLVTDQARGKHARCARCGTLQVFPIVIVGGLDSIPGTIVGALVIGVVESLAAGYIDAIVGGGFSHVASYRVLLAALFVRPYGLFGRPDVQRV